MDVKVSIHKICGAIWAYPGPSIQSAHYWARLLVPPEAEGNGVGCRSGLTVGTSGFLVCKLSPVKGRKRSSVYFS